MNALTAGAHALRAAAHDAGWPAPIPAMRSEQHFGDRVVDCFAERPASIPAMLDQAISHRPHGEALVAGAVRLTWLQVGEQVATLASGLAGQGVARGDRIALLLGNRIEFVIAWLAAARLGAISVPISTRVQKPELQYMLVDAGASVVIHDEVFDPLLPTSAEAPALRLRIAVESTDGPASWRALMSGVTKGATGDARPGPADPPQEDETALLVYTSGTTGHPKGAMLSHGNIVHGAMHYQVCMGLGAADRSLVAVPMSHVTGLVALLSSVVRCASTLVLMPTFQAAEFLALAARERITHTVLVPAMYKLCLLRPDFDEHELSAWRVGGYGGAPMAPATQQELARRLPRLQLMNAYGATETACAVAIMPARDTLVQADRVGRAVPCAEFRVMDANGRELPAGEQGELWVRGPMVARGYWNKPDATAESFIGGFWRSGDIGSINAAGFVGVYDRSKDMINRGGYKIFTIEVENVLFAHPAVREVAVVAKPCPVLGERVHAFVTHGEEAPDAEALRLYCAERLSDYKVPESFTLSTEPLPRTATGKVIKRQLREQAADFAPVLKKTPA
jgi:acyl-CoA synthetase (AMP-forming)/AMP-acid ligase II